jgi:hypothetical protein
VSEQQSVATISALQRQLLCPSASPAVPLRGQEMLIQARQCWLAIWLRGVAVIPFLMQPPLDDATPTR